MCGIAGVKNYSKYELDYVKQALFHRGPDEQSIYYYKDLALIHSRLAIQDIKYGQQPMHWGQYTIIFNGEIYNHLELRDHYLNDYTFKTHSDTETLLHLFDKFKFKMFDLLDGMYAFAILDKTTNSLVIARDRSGKKPLYYYVLNDECIFASELGAIKSLVKLAINENAIDIFLRTGFFSQTLTPYQDVHELPAGCYLHINLDTLNFNIHHYFNMLEYYQMPKLNLSLAEATAQTESLLIKSVRNRLLSSDVEVGVFLSGGIDSNLIVATAASMQSRLKTFTVKVPGNYDESSLAKLTARRYNTSHHEIEIDMSGTLKDDIDKILFNYGEPFADSSAIPSYYVSKAARENVSVILNGDGADELFGGYRRYVPYANNWLSYLKYFSWIKSCLSKAQHRSALGFLSRLLNMSHKTGLNLYLASTTDIFEDIYQFADNQYLQNMNDDLNQILFNQKMTPLSKILYFDFVYILKDMLLVKMDIATMAHSLEGRSPFMSKYFLEFAPLLPDQFKINRLTTKYVLRQLATKYLDREIVKLPKKGFEVPLADIVDNVLYDKIHSFITGDSYIKRYVDSNFIHALLNKRLPISSVKRAKAIWSLFCVEVWHRNDQKDFVYR